MFDRAHHPIRLELTLELEPGADPPCGRLLTAGGGVPFSGWLGFALALEQMIEGASDSGQAERGEVR